MKAAFVFPGQGSQSVGMMGVFEKLPAVRETFDEASGYLGIDLWKLVQEGPAEKLNETVNTQPVMLVAGVAMYRAWQASSDIRPALLAGHSLGEYSALVASGMLKFSDAVPLVRYRAQAMQDAVPAGVGAIAAIIGLEDDAIRQVCSEASVGEQQVEAANFNSPSQVVIAGHKVAVERGMELAKTKGAKRAMLLPMSVPSHCALMRPAAMQLKNRLGQIALHAGSIPVLQNADVAAASTEAKVKDALVRQLYQPVRWVETVRALVAAGATHVLECGPGKVLAGLNKRIVPDAKILTFGDLENFQDAVESFKGDRIES
jgi:[acyl-carrier-protein] S-malonyltransferase